MQGLGLSPASSGPRCTWLYRGVPLVAFVVLACGQGAPLYDGIGFPDEPYRFVNPPPGYQQHVAPTEARQLVPLSGGTNAREASINSGETGPQVAVYLPVGSLIAADRGATGAIVTARPVRLVRPPADGTASSNLYDVSFEGPRVAVSQSLSPPANITLREASLDPILPTMEFRPTATARWQRLKTDQIGRDIYVAALAGQGQYVLVRPGPGAPHSRRDGGSHVGFALAIAVSVLLILCVLLAVRRLPVATDDTRSSGPGAS
jgi:hypothetical protein